MKLVDKRVTDVVSGYDAIMQAETDLRSHWRLPLIATYAKRRKNLDHAQSSAYQRKSLTQIGGILGLLLVLVGSGFTCAGITQENSNLLLFCCGGPLLALLGILIIGAVSFSQFGRSKSRPKRIPMHPLRSGSLQKGIFPDLRQSWAQGLAGNLMEEVPDYPGHYAADVKDYGAEGERMFIQRLAQACCDEDFILARSMQRPNEDVDVILIGTKGLWVFEVKHWSGEIYWDDKGWRREQTYYERGGMEVTKTVEVGEPPDQQWIRAATDVVHTLQHYTADIFEKYPAFKKMRGGIVFTHPDAELKFQAGRPSFWGSLPFWIKTLQEIETKADLDTRSTLRIVEALLKRHHELTLAKESRSMVVYAQRMVDETEEKLHDWVQE